MQASRSCKADRPITDGLNTDLHLDIGNGVRYRWKRWINSVI